MGDVNRPLACCTLVASRVAWKLLLNISLCLPEHDAHGLTTTVALLPMRFCAFVRGWVGLWVSGCGFVQSVRGLPVD